LPSRRLHLTTAAELAQGGPPPPTAPDQFHQGMVVRHPEYGLGRVVALSGSGEGRKATVAFQTGQRKFVIAQSPLRPVKK
jgi:DNA helicase-2/ATP-dependent DNA helicase PcrA